jgi:hypothetical protein
MATLVDYPSFSDSPFFFDRRNLHIPLAESSHVQVSYGVQGFQLTTASLGAACIVLPPKGCWQLPLRSR